MRAVFNIVMVEPEIPANTGNVARTCAVTGCSLHLVEPLGFLIDDKHLKRAGLDYWHLLDVHIHHSLQEFMETVDQHKQLYLATTKGGRRYDQVRIEPGSYLLFGKETKGLPEWLLKEYPEQCLRIPMRDEARSLNLSNSVAILVYEALRQNNFAGLR